MIKNYLQKAVVLLTGTTISLYGAGCARHPEEIDTEMGNYAVKPARGSKPYTINGQTYYPLAHAHGFRETGVASWYGPGFHGKTTANGEQYNMFDMTAAHRVLPFDTNVKVTNLDNGRSIVVRVNDRGPFVDDRVIDLTKSGAEKLGMMGNGTARVRVEAINTINPNPVETLPPIATNTGQAPPKTTPAGTQTAEKKLPPAPTPAPSGGNGKYYVQVGAFSEKQNAQSLARQINNNGMGSRVQYTADRKLWRVQAGPFSNVAQAEQANQRLRGRYSTMIVMAD